MSNFNNFIGKSQVKFRKLFIIFMVLLSAILCCGCEWIFVGVGIYGCYRIIISSGSVKIHLKDPAPSCKKIPKNVSIKSPLNKRDLK